MPRQQDCLEIETLANFLLGHVEEVRAAEIETHLSKCAKCATSLNKIDAEDALVESIRAAAAQPTPYDEDRDETVVVKFRPDPPALPTQRFGPADTIDDLDKILSASQEEGELGRIGPYRILAVLGQGGMGIVFRAEDPTLGRHIAIKVLRPELLNKPNMWLRFLREARATYPFNVSPTYAS